MTITPYATFEDVINFTGFRPDDMDFLGEEMNLPQFKRLVKTLILASSNLVNRYCNVETFYEHEVVDELHTMDSSDLFTYTYGIWRPFSFYNDQLTSSQSEHTSTIYPREQPVKEITSVKVKKSYGDQEPIWIDLTEATIDSRGDYQIIDRFDTTSIYLIRKYPMWGKNNVRLSYVAGFSNGSAELENIKIATALIVGNYLISKKKKQEVATIRGAGISDYAPLFSDTNNNKLLSDDVLLILNMYRRQPLDPSMYE